MGSSRPAGAVLLVIGVIYCQGAISKDNKVGSRVQILDDKAPAVGESQAPDYVHPALSYSDPAAEIPASIQHFGLLNDHSNFNVQLNLGYARRIQEYKTRLAAMPPEELHSLEGMRMTMVVHKLEQSRKEACAKVINTPAVNETVTFDDGSGYGEAVRESRQATQRLRESRETKSPQMRSLLESLDDHMEEKSSFDPYISQYKTECTAFVAELEGRTQSIGQKLLVMELTQKALTNNATSTGNNTRRVR